MNRQSSNNDRKVRWRWLLKWKNALNHDYKTNNGHNFQFSKFLFTDFFLTDRRSLPGKRPKSASDKSSSCRFSLSAERNTNTKATEYVTFTAFLRACITPQFMWYNNLTCFTNSFCQSWQPPPHPQNNLVIKMQFVT